MPPVVSVVTPFYNTAEYLEQCVESVLAQRFTDFDYVLVDNYSTDGSAGIAAKYAARDARVRVVKPPEFLKQSYNYNFALEQIDPRSRYTKMAQADDWLFPGCLGEMVALADANPSVGIVSSYRLVGTWPGGFGLDPERNVWSGREACRLQLIDELYPFGSPTTVLYRSDIVRKRQPFYSNTALNPDTEAVFEILASSDFAYVHQVLSYSRRQEESISHSIRDFNPYALDHLIIAKKYGHQSLAPDELDRVLERDTRAFYRGLAKQWLSDRVGAETKGFWEYQRRGLTDIGEELSPVQLARAAAGLALGAVASPGRAFAAASRTARGSRVR